MIVVSPSKHRFSQYFSFSWSLSFQTFLTLFSFYTLSVIR